MSEIQVPGGRVIITFKPELTDDGVKSPAPVKNSSASKKKEKSSKISGEYIFLILGIGGCVIWFLIKYYVSN